MLNLSRNELLKIEKPARYVGGEYNQVIKNKRNIKCRFALCFPDIYEVGMSDFTLRALYEILNKRTDTWCERVFAPWFDFEELLKKKNMELYLLESKESVKNTDIATFFVQDELQFTNVLNMLDMSGIPVLSSDRKEEYPFVVSLGKCMYNPYPLSKFVDICIIGDSENITEILVEKYISWKENKLPKIEFLKSIKDIKGIFVPSIHTNLDDISVNVIDDLDSVYHPLSVLVPNINIEQNKVLLEVTRGSNSSKIFSESCFEGKGVRKRNTKKLVKVMEKSIKETGINEIFIISDKEDFDYNELFYEIEKLNKIVQISVPKLKVKSENIQFFKMMEEQEKMFPTFELYGTSNRLRSILGTNIKKEEILDRCQLLYLNGFFKIKFNYVLGLPTETFDDLKEVVELSKEIIEKYDLLPDVIKNDKCVIDIHVSTFVPRPCTPFEFFGQNNISKIELKQKYLKDNLNIENINLSFDNPYESQIKAVLARGDIKISDVIYNAWLYGAKFDNFYDIKSKEAWKKAFNKLNIAAEDYACKEYEDSCTFIWDNITGKENKEILKDGYTRIIENKTIL